MACAVSRTFFSYIGGMDGKAECLPSGRVPECRRAQDAKRDSKSPFRLALDDSLRPRFTPLRDYGYGYGYGYGTQG